MSRGFNQCTFIGNLGDDPEMRYTQSGVPIATISIAVNEQWKDKKTGEKQERVEWVRCTAFDKLAEIVEEYCRKGDPIFVQGRMQTDRVEDRDGGPDKFFTKIILEKVQLLGGGGRDRDEDRGGGGQRRSTGNHRGRDDDERSSSRRAPPRRDERPASREDSRGRSSYGSRDDRPPSRQASSDQPPARHDEPFPDDDIPFN